MYHKKIKLAASQNIRYSGRTFPGYTKSQPYMVFINYQGEHEAKVNYNGKITIVSKYDITPVAGFGI
jgi:hypothetical protein